MAFVSSVLTDNKVCTLLSDSNVSSIKEMTTSVDESYIYSILEFNEKLHRIEIEDKIDYYRALVESINGDKSKLEGIYESMLVNAIKRLGEIVTAIIEWIKNKLQDIFEINRMSQTEFNMKKKTSKGFVRNIDIEKEYTFTCFNYPRFDNLDSKICDDALKDIFSNIDEICNGRDLPEASDTTLKLAYSKLSKSIEDSVKSDAISVIRREYLGPREDKESFVKFINNNIIFRYREKMHYYTWKDKFIDPISDIGRDAINSKMR